MKALQEELDIHAVVWIRIKEIFDRDGLDEKDISQRALISLHFKEDTLRIIGFAFRIPIYPGELQLIIYIEYKILGIREVFA